MIPSELPTIIVPARMASTRFPGKLMADTGGKPLILRTAERIQQEAPEFELFFAVDGDELFEVLNGNGFSCVHTQAELPSGTDRIAQANQSLGRHSVINVQADEPLVCREHLLALVAGLEKGGADLATLAVPFQKLEHFNDSNQVKVVLDNNGFALYFSRSTIPFDREGKEPSFDCSFKRLGMYGYTNSFLEKFSSSKQGKLEMIEKLEQLRALEMGYRIAVEIVEFDTIGIDVPSDLKKLYFEGP